MKRKQFAYITPLEIELDMEIFNLLRDFFRITLILNVFVKLSLFSI